MKRTITALTAAIFATAIALPAFAQVGAGVAGNANVPDSGMHAGANADIANSDAERAEPASPTDNSPTAIRRHAHHRENSAAIDATRNDRGVGASAGTNVGSPITPDAHVGPRANAGTDNSPTGGY